MPRKSIGTTVVQLLVATLVVLTSTVSLFTSSAQAAYDYNWIKNTTWNGHVNPNGGPTQNPLTIIICPQYCHDLKDTPSELDFRGTLDIDGKEGKLTDGQVVVSTTAVIIFFKGSLAGCGYNGTLGQPGYLPGYPLLSYTISGGWQCPDGRNGTFTLSKQ